MENLAASVFVPFCVGTAPAWRINMQIEINGSFYSVMIAQYDSITAVEDDRIFQMKDGRIVLMNSVAFHIFSLLISPDIGCVSERHILRALRESFATEGLSDERLLADIRKNIEQLRDSSIIIISPETE